jgi:hypothetical protein
MKPRQDRGGRGLDFARVLEVPFEIEEGKTKTVDLSSF